MSREFPSKCAPTASSNCRDLVRKTWVNHSWSLGILIFLGVVYSLMLILCARGDLWLDEIWSFNWIPHFDGISGLLALAHDNNHPLNTIWMKWIGPAAPALAIRGLAVLSGLGSFLILVKLAARLDRDVVIPAGILFCFSYPLILYFSEARGYGPALFLSLFSTYLAITFWHRPVVAPAFWVSCFLAVFAHATAVMVVGPVILWLGVRFIGVRRSRRSYYLEYLLWVLPPASFIALFYLQFLRKMEIGGGPQYGLLAVLGNLSGYAIGLPAMLPAAIWALAIFCGIICAGIYFLPERNVPQARILFLSILVIAPIAVLLISRPQVIYFRYFAVILPFFYLVAGSLVSLLVKFGKWGRIGTGLVLGLYVILQIPAISGLATHARGGYREAIRLMCAGPEVTVTVGSDHDFRNKTLINFFRKNTAEFERIRYVDQTNWERSAPDWILLHTQTCPPPEPERAITAAGGEYRFIRLFPFSGVSGWHWYLYRRIK